MLDYGINFNTEEGVKKATKEIEEASRKWQAMLSKSPLSIKFNKNDFDNFVNGTSKLKAAGKNVDSFNERVKSMRAQFRALTSQDVSIGGGQKLIDQYRALQKEAGIYAGTIDQAVKAQDRMAKESEKTTTSINRQTNAYKRQSEVMIQLKSYAMNFLSVYGGIRLTKNLIDITGEFESQKVALKSILMDAEKGEAIFARIKDLAVVSPFQVKHLVSYAKQLSAFSVPYEELYDTTKMLADVSSGLGVDMSRIILAYGQVRSAAVLRGQELRQFTEAGIPLVDELAKKFTELKGEVVSASEVFDLISQRQVPFQMVKDLFVEMTSEGGKFYKMQEKQAETLKGKVSNLTDAFEIMLSEIGEKGSGVLKGSIDATRWLMENYDAIGRILLTLVATYGAYRAAVLVSAAAETIRYQATLAQMAGLTRMQAITDVLRAKTALLNKTLLANPYAIVAAAVVGLAASIYLYTTRADAAERATKAWNDQLKEQEDIAEEERSKIRGLIQSIKDETTTRLAKETALKDLQSIMPDVFKDMDVEAIKLASLTSLMTAYNESAEKRNQLQLREKVQSGRDLLNSKDGDWRWSVAERQQAQRLMGKSTNIFTVTGTPTKDIIEEFTKWVEQGEKKIKDLDKTVEEIASNPIVYDNLETLKKSLSDAEKTLSDLQAKARKGLIPVEDVKAQQEVVEKLKTDLSLMGWSEPKPGDVKKDNKDVEKRVKEYLDTIQSQVDEYKKKFDIWSTIYEGSGKKPAIDFDITFNGEPDVSKYIKTKMQEIGGGKLNLDVDFLTADFSDILNGATFDSQTVDRLKSLFKELQDSSFSDYKGLADLYAKYADYTVKKTNLDKKYIEERNKLLDSNADEAILKEQLRVYREESDKLVMEFAEKDKAFNDFVSSIANKSVDSLRFLLMELQASLTKETVTGGDNETILMLRAKISALEEQLKNAKIKTDGQKEITGSYKQWKNLQSVLSKVGREFDEIGDAVGGVAGEIISLAGNISTSTMSMINGIVLLANWSIHATEMTAKGTAKAIQSVEKASVILAVISAAFQIATKVWSFFNKTKEVSQSTIDQYEALLDVTNKVIDAQKELIETMSGSDALKVQKETLDILEKQRQATINLAKEYVNSGSSSGFLGIGAKNSYGVRMYQSLKKYEKEFNDLGIDWKAISGEVPIGFVNATLGDMRGLFDMTAKQIKDFQMKMPEAWARLDEETRKYLETLAEIDKKTAELEATTKTAVTGIEFGDLLSGFEDFIEAADNGVEALAENFENYMLSAIMNIVKTQYLTDELKKWYESFSVALSDNELSLAEKEALRKEYEDIMNEGKRRVDAAKDIAGVGSTDSNLTGISKAVAGMSEDTALIFGGYLNSIRDKFFPVADYWLGEHRVLIADMVVHQQDMVAHLAAIEANTKSTAESNTAILKKISDVIVPGGKAIKVEME